MMDASEREFELSRRELLRRGAAGLVFLAGASAWLGGCASGSRGVASSNGAGDMPDLNWPDDPFASASSKYATCPKPVAQPAAAELPTGVIPRSAWARAGQVTSRMDLADRPFDRITVHHDGLPGTFTNPSQNAAAARLEQIRIAHLNRAGEPFGDIGYHYLIDPAGRVWQGRPIKWQGAHVRGQNPGNLGICMLGNYNNQTPNRAQLARLNQFVAEQMRVHRVPLTRIYTHQELARTECPGNSLQSYMKSTRLASGDLARIVRA